MNLFAGSTTVETNDFLPIELQISHADTPAIEVQLERVQFKTLQKSRREILFEIDRSLPPDSNISIKMAKRSFDQKMMGEVYKVHRGRVQYCNRVKSSRGSRYEVCVQIHETVIQTDIRFSRLNFR